ncbi:hypothetical protein Vadar_024986 [Vaccinium darrowii]|uniref:Uncharacterized protein n=1 Tax=Vaccinium darrowii TaxID=229202 RepID=A0ACB7YFW9_9ERIC|nr:hypothetical protein Vadar_024986 [Vaccinium darrowii]
MDDPKSQNDEFSVQPHMPNTAFNPPRKPKRNKDQDDLKISDVQLEIVMGIIELYSLIGAAFAGRTSDWVGRRYTIVIAAALFFAGALFSTIATNYAFLMVGRFVAGLGVGFALLIAPGLHHGARSGLLSCFPHFFPRSLHQRWCIAGIYIKLVDSARQSRFWTRLQIQKRRLSFGSPIYIKEAAGIYEECNDDIVQVPKRSHGKDVWKELFLHPTPTVKHILIAGVGIHFFQQASGIDAVVLYSPKIFGKAAMIAIFDDVDEFLYLGEV